MNPTPSDKYDPPHASLSYAAIQDIEAALEVSLPDHYKHSLMHNPFKGTEMDEGLFWNETDRIIARNIVNRKVDWFGREWPEDALQIGDSSDQGAVFIQLGADHSKIYFYHWEMEELLVVSEQFKISDSLPLFYEEWLKQDQY